MLEVYPILDEKSFQNEVQGYLGELVTEFNSCHPTLKFDCNCVTSSSFLEYQLIVLKRDEEIDDYYSSVSIVPRGIIVSSGQYYQHLNAPQSQIKPDQVIGQATTISPDTVVFQV
jgi:hypothetical protein